MRSGKAGLNAKVLGGGMFFVSGCGLAALIDDAEPVIFEGTEPVGSALD